MELPLIQSRPPRGIFHNSYLGSADIDLVGPSMGGLFDNTLEGFECSQGYQAVTTDPLGLQTSFRKPVIEAGEIVGHARAAL